MPELPEVETVARDLAAALVGRRILAVEVRHPAVIAAPPAEEFATALAGQAIAAVRRRAKYIIVDLARPGANPVLLAAPCEEPPVPCKHLAVHLRMTGRLLLQPSGTPPEKHTHLVFTLSGLGAGPSASGLLASAGPVLAREALDLHFCDTRRFGRMWLVDDAALGSLLASLGPEPLEDSFSVEHLAAALGGRSTKLKPLLLDQRRLAGLGNIYADEALFEACLHPAREAQSLSPVEVERLHRAIRRVLADAVHHRGTSLRDAEYRDAHGQKGYHQEHVAIFRRQGLPCPRCTEPIQRIRLGGRSSHFCPQCQPSP